MPCARYIATRTSGFEQGFGVWSIMVIIARVFLIAFRYGLGYGVPGEGRSVDSFLGS